MSSRSRALVSLLVAGAFLVIGGTGVLLYTRAHSNLTAAVHTSFGALFLVVIGLHVRNNARPLATYAQTRRRQLAFACVLTAALLGGMVYELPGFAAIYGWGNQLRAGQEHRREDRQPYQYLETNTAGTGAPFELEVKKGKAFAFPAFAVWIEDEHGHFVETLYGLAGHRPQPSPEERRRQVGHGRGPPTGGAAGVGPSPRVARARDRSASHRWCTPQRWISRHPRATTPSIRSATGIPAAGRGSIPISRR